ncbi:hypothetical protein GCM10009001_14080 [Virgibacillus siamensis]|uniref:CopC domain-containing protein n=1 Tax=Virgibacillus siamensis TaxID=480071 RepID=A0ABP3QWP9_9BACI
MLKNTLATALFIFLLMALVPMHAANAHSVLEKSSPANGQKLEKSINNVTLNFNTKIEKGSTLYLVDDQGNKLQPASVKITDDVLTASFQKSLNSGTYQVKWEVVGADGHLIENQYSFTIKKDEAKQPKNNASQNEGEQSGNSNKDKTGQSNQDTEERNSSEQKTNNEDEQSFPGNGIIIVLVIAGIVLIAWMFFSKRTE